MPVHNSLKFLLGAAPLLVACGCASAYHAYPCGCVGYGYRGRPPLPYAAYDACITPVAHCYLNAQSPPTTESEAPPPAAPSPTDGRYEQDP